MKTLTKKADCLISNNLNNYLDQLTVLGERLLYVVVNEIKKKYYEKNYDIYDKVTGKVEDDGISTYEIKIKGSIIRKALSKKRPSFKSVIKILESFSNTIHILFDYTKYDKNTDVFEIELAYDFYEYIFISVCCENFTRIYYDEFMNINSKLGQKLYRLCSRYIEQQFLNQKIEDFRFYFKFENLKISEADKKIKKAINKINKYTQFKVTYTKNKKNKKITNIIWKFDI